MKLRAFAYSAALTALAAMTLVVVAQARNEHCAGGIQYVVGGMRDKEKGNIEDYKNQMVKAVNQLSICATESPDDFEAMGYLGWAYCELDSAEAAGKAFKVCLDGMKAKGDKKLQQWVNNRQGYWVTYYNSGIGDMKAALDMYPDMGLKPKNDSPDEKKLWDDARGKYHAAVATFKKATLLNPQESVAYLSMGQAYQFLGDFAAAEDAFKAGLTVAPNDSLLQGSMVNLRKNKATQLINDKKFDEAVAYFSDLIKSEPNNVDLLQGLGNAYFEKAQQSGVADSDKKAWFKSAGDAWAKAGALKPADFDLAYNAGIALNGAGDLAGAEPQFRRALSVNADDLDAASALGSVLIGEGKYQEAVTILHKAVLKNPKKPELHQRLSVAYDKGGNKPKSTEAAMVFLALRGGKPVADAAAAAQSSTVPAQINTLKSVGKPDDIFEWKADADTYQTWLYWSKGLAFHFKAGNLVMKSDWSAPATVSDNAPRK